MATELYNTSEITTPSIHAGKGKTFALIVSEWNTRITQSMCDAAIQTLCNYGVEKDNITVHYVPGSFELIYGTSKMAEGAAPDAIIAIGCVIKGDTPHFDYICQSVATNLGYINTQAKCPVIFGVLTTNTLEQALDRSGGKLGNKGAEAAITALIMAENFAW